MDEPQTRQLMGSVQVLAPPTMPWRRSLTSISGGPGSILIETSNSPSQGLAASPLASDFLFGRAGFLAGVDLAGVSLGADGSGRWSSGAPGASSSPFLTWTASVG